MFILTVCIAICVFFFSVSKSLTDSYYGKPNKTIHLRSVSCSGSEMALSDCSLNKLSVLEGKLLLANTSVAGMDCRSTFVPAVIGGSIGSVVALLLAIILAVIVMILINKRSVHKSIPYHYSTWIIY